MLIHELDKLRDKTLSFGCCVERGYWISSGQGRPDNVLVMIEEKGYYGNVLEYPRICSDNYSHNEIIGHPINWGRLYMLRHGIKPSYLEMGEPDYDHAKYNEFYLCFEDIKDLMYHIGFDKSEIERMQSEYWEDLKKLLIEFCKFFTVQGQH